MDHAFLRWLHSIIEIHLLVLFQAFSEVLGELIKARETSSGCALLPNHLYYFVVLICHT